MKHSKKLVVTVSLLLLGLAIAPQSPAFSIREILGLEDNNQTVAAETRPAAAPAARPAAQPPADAREWGKPSNTGSDATLELSQVQMVLANLAPNQRQALLADQKTFQRFAQQEADNISVLAAARANNVDKDSNTVFLMQRSADTVVRETYLNRLVAAKVPADFPTDAQVREYYDKNKDKLVLGERFHVWQIFLPLADPKDNKAAAALQKQAEGIASDISEGKLDFGEAAAKYSTHDPSRHNGGYMGLVAVSQLKPDISKSLLSLAEGAVSKPIHTDAGLHILKRGARVAAEPLSLEEAAPQIRQLLINQARGQLRQAIYDQARKSYPLALPDSKVEEWRLRLRTNLEAASPPPAGRPAAEKKP